eukprot:4069676-Ditylum_brightwellii.AAC.1
MVRDIVKDSLANGVELQQVELESYFMPEESLELSDILSKIMEVYIINCILGAQPTLIDHLRCITRAAITPILSVLPFTAHSGHTNRREPISLKKALKGDTRWAIHKVVLGFLLDGKAQTIWTPPDKLQTTLEEVQNLLKQSRATPAQYCCVLGKMHHLAAIAPPGLGLFTPLNRALAIQKGHIGLGKKSEVCIAMEALATILKDTTICPTHVHKLVRMLPTVTGYCDAAAEGVG